MKLYHATDFSNLSDILDEGFKALLRSYILCGKL